ncbi:MAG: PilW family protein [Armatimonadota bacterium]
MTEGRSGRAGVPGAACRQGFTLIEVLVVLAILVILFALLFAPMIASLDMVTLGQSRVTMQNAVRTAMEEMRREISNAMYIYPTPGVTLKGADGLLGTGDDVRLANYSEIVFVTPERTATGQLAQPLAPRTDGAGNILATRLRAALVDETQPYSEDNPFVLVREEGYYTRNEDATRVWWDFTNVGGAANPIRNLLTPRSNYDFPVSRTICGQCGAVIEGYTTACPSGCAGELIYVHDNLQFRPERVLGEVLRASADNTIYQAQHAAWAGLYNPGTIELNNIDGLGTLGQLGASELDPRIVVINPVDMSVKRDSFDSVDNSNMIITWNSDSGTIQVGATTGRWVNVPDPMATIPPGQYYPLSVQDTRPDLGAAGTTDDYDMNGALAGARQWDLVPIYPSLGPLTCTDCGGTYDPTLYRPGDPCPNPSCSGTLVSTAQPGDPAMPIAYRIDPTRAGALAPAKIVPGSIRVVVWGRDALGTPYQSVYSETTNTNPAEIGVRQFAVVSSDFGQRAEVRFNELQPPSPRMFTAAGIAVQDFGIYIQYYFRRNYDPLTPQTDYITKADYSTQQVMNLYLALQRWWEPEPHPSNPDALVIPPDATPDRVSVQDQVEVRNLSR